MSAVSYRLVAPEEKDKRPSGVYKDVIVKGAREHKLPKHYIKRLETIEDNGYRGEAGPRMCCYMRLLCTFIDEAQKVFEKSV